jgi:hypothetical protein
MAVNSQAQYVPLQRGCTTTALPVLQTYYWPEDDGSPVTEERAMLMASYGDGVNISYWDGFHDKRGIWWHEELQHREPLKRFEESALAKAEPGSTWHDYAAPEVMVKEVQCQLALIHGLSFIPHAQDAAYKD